MKDVRAFTAAAGVGKGHGGPATNGIDVKEPVEPGKSSRKSNQARKGRSRLNPRERSSWLV